MARRYYTLAEAARKLERSEASTRTLLRKHEIEPVARALERRGRAHLYDAELVDGLAAMLQGAGSPRFRIVATVDVPDEVDDALYAIGAVVKPAANVLDAISCSHPDDIPIIVLSSLAAHEDAGILARLSDQMRVIVYDGSGDLRSVALEVGEAVAHRKAMWLADIRAQGFDA